MNRRLTWKIIFPLIVIGIFTAGGCGANPPFAPFGSTVTILDPPANVTIPNNSLTTFLVQALVVNSAGQPLNSVRVIWEATFAGQNDLVVDTNGDTVADARAVQLVNEFACSPNPCSNTPLQDWKMMNAFVDSPYETLTDDRGIAFVEILLSGKDINVLQLNPVTLEASTDSGSVAVVTFTVTGPAPTPAPTPIP